MSSTRLASMMRTMSVHSLQYRNQGTVCSNRYSRPLCLHPKILPACEGCSTVDLHATDPLPLTAITIQECCIVALTIPAIPMPLRSCPASSPSLALSLCWDSHRIGRRSLHAANQSEHGKERHSTAPAGAAASCQACRWEHALLAGYPEQCSLARHLLGRKGGALCFRGNCEPRSPSFPPTCQNHRTKAHFCPAQQAQH